MGVVVVTGAAGGVGSAIVDALLHAGEHVVAVDRSTPDPRDGVRAIVGDGGDAATAARAIDAAQRLGGLTGWVNNSAVFRDVWLDDDPEGVLEVIDANLRPAVVGSAAAVGAFRRSGIAGAIVNVSSHQAVRPVRGSLPYAVAKAALEGMTRALAVDHGPDGIRVNAVALGSVRTARYDDHLDVLGADARAAVVAAMATLHPLGRVGEAREVGGVVRFLLSPDASFLSGAVIPLDGGRSVRGADPEERER